MSWDGGMDGGRGDTSGGLMKVGRRDRQRTESIVKHWLYVHPGKHIYIYTVYVDLGECGNLSLK